MIVAIVLASLAVLAAVVLLAMGKGGALSEVHPDHPPLTFSLDRAFDPDAPPPRLPHGLWGYQVKITDEALNRLVKALAERDQRIALLEQQLLKFGRERGMGGMEADGGAAMDWAAAPAASTMPDFIGGQAPYAAQPAQATRSPYGEHYDAEPSSYAEPSSSAERSPFAPPAERRTEPPSQAEDSAYAVRSSSSPDTPQAGDVPPGSDEPPRARWWLDSTPSLTTAAGVPSGGWGDEPGPASPPTEPRKSSQSKGGEPAGHNEKPGGSDADTP